MALPERNSTASSRGRHSCLHAQHRQRAPFSSAALNRSHKSRRREQQLFPTCCTLISQPLESQAQPCSPLSASRSFSFSTYRDDGALSEVSIADSLCHEAPPTQIEAAAAPAKLQTADFRPARAATPAQVSTAAETARRRQLRQCYPASHSDILGSQATNSQIRSQRNSNFLERRPKVQIAWRLQGCIMEPVPDPPHHRTGVLDSEEQLALWYQYDCAVRAAAQSQALHRQVGQTASDSQIAAALGLLHPFSLSQCLAAGKSAKLQLVASNMGLVYKVAHQYKRSKDAGFADLVQEGLQGLDKGLRMYSPSRGAKLSTALFWYIRAAIFTSHRRETPVIHIPLTTQEQIGQLRSVLKEYQLLHPGQYPSDQHLMKAMRLSKLAIGRIKQASALKQRSFDVLATAHGFGASDMGDTGDSMIDLLTSGDGEAAHKQQRSMLNTDVQSLITMLPDPLGPVLQLRYGLQDGEAKTYDEVAKHLNLSAYKVAQHHRAALAVLHASDSTQHLATAFAACC